MAGGHGLSTGPNSRPLNDTVSETGPGIPDDAVMDGELAPGELGIGADRAVEALERSGWAPPPKSDAAAREADAAAESEAHPS